MQVHINRRKQQVGRSLSTRGKTANIGKNLGSNLGSAIAMALVCASGMVWAQSARADDASDDGKLGDIVVTARHVKEDAQKAPIAMSVYSADALKRNGITDITGLATMAPDVNLTITEGQAVVTVRGISSRDTNENGDPAVSVSTDGFFVNRPYALNAVMYDLDRIEVLRGPQGTLSGRNSVGGTINIITAKPTDTLAGYASAQYGNYNALEFQGMVNVPVTPNLQARVAFLSSSHDGYRNTSTPTNGDSADNKSVRLTLAYQPVDNLHMQLTAQYTSQTGSGDVLQYIPFIYTSSGALVHDLPAGINAKTFTLGAQPFVKIKDTQIRGNIVYDAGRVQVTLLGGYDKVNYSQAIDQSLPTASPPVYLWQPNQYPDTINAELRFASNAPSPFQWQFGGFYFNERSHLMAGDAQPLNTGSGGYNYFFGFVYKTRARSEAGYAHASYQIAPDLKLSGGLRYSHDYKFETGYSGDLTGGIVYGSGTGSSSSSKLTYSAGLDYSVTPTSLLYAKIDTGYKAGGFNLGGSSYKPESVTSYEIGSKNRFLDDTLQLNLAAYYSNYTDQQVSTYTTLPSGQSVALTLNAGRSRVYGAEADVIYKFLPGWQFDFNANYLHARYTYFLAAADPSDPAQSGNVQLKGNSLPQAPAWSLTAGLEKAWSTPIGKLWRAVTKQANGAPAIC